MTFNNTTLPANLYAQSYATSSSSPFVVEFQARDPTINDTPYPIQKIWLNTTTNNFWFLKNFNTIATGGIVQAHWIQLGGGGSFADQYVTDDGTAVPALGILNVLTGLSTDNCGSSVYFKGTGNTVELNVTDGGDNTIIGRTAGNTSGAQVNSTGLGFGVLGKVTNGIDNSFLGSGSGGNITSGSGNSGLGMYALAFLLTGNYNIAIGLNAGDNYSGAESNNICIGNQGVISESNVIRIGTQGSGNFQQDKCFISGIVGVTVSNPAYVTINTSTGQLGVTSESSAVNYTNVTHMMSPYTVLSTDYYLSVDGSGGAVTLKFPNAPTANQIWIVKDRLGVASTNNISITTPGGTVTFDGETTYTIAGNYGAVNILANSTPTYEIW